MIACVAAAWLLGPRAWADVGDAGGLDAGADDAALGAGGLDAGAGVAPLPLDAGGPAIVALPLDVKAPEVHAAASPSEVRLGARFTLFVTATYGDGVEVNLREPLDLGPAFEIRRRLSEDRPRADGKHVREWQLEVLAWELGDLRLPPIAVTFTAGGQAGQVESEAVPIRVVGVRGAVDDGATLRDLAPPRELVRDDWTWVYLAGAGAGGAVIGALVLVAWRRRRRHARRLVAGLAAPAVLARLDRPGQRALEALLALETSGALLDPARRQAGYAALVEILRAFLAARHGFVAVDVTSAELLRQVEAHAPSLRPRLERWLDACDRVKYGAWPTAGVEATAALAEARALVLADGGEPTAVAA